MTIDLIKQGNDLTQNVQLCLAKALEAAQAGVAYDTDWEKAMQYQSELLGIINKLKYQKTSRVSVLRSP